MHLDCVFTLLILNECVWKLRSRIRIIKIIFSNLDGSHKKMHRISLANYARELVWNAVKYTLKGDEGETD